MSTALATPCDRGTVEAHKGRSARHPAWTIAATMLASSLAFIDGSVTNVALPAIGKDLNAGAANLPWIINAYLLPLSALLLLGGAAGDHYGRLRMLIGGICLFTLASVACALAPNLEVMLASRAVQGIGAAILLPNSLGILGSSFEGEARGRAVGTWAAAGSIASAIGPPLGGWLVEAIGWRAIFYLNVPVALAALAIAAGLESWLGLGAGAMLLLVFLLTERRLGDRAMMPLALFGSRAFVGLSLLTFLLYAALGGLLVLLPFLLINGGGYSLAAAGFALLPFSIVLGTTSRFSGRLAERIGPRWAADPGSDRHRRGIRADGAGRPAR